MSIHISRHNVANFHIDGDKEEFDSMEAEATRRLQMALYESQAAAHILAEIRRARAEGTLAFRGIYVGKRVTVNFRDGRRDGVLEGITGDLPNNICVRLFTARGRPCKAVAHIPVEDVGAVLKERKESGGN